MFSTFEANITNKFVHHNPIECNAQRSIKVTTTRGKLPAFPKSRQTRQNHCVLIGRQGGIKLIKHTQQQAKVLGLRGYCMNTEKGTVQGRMQGTADKVVQMKKWLQEVGSPSSRIDKAVFTNEQEIKKYTDSSFIIKR